MLFFISHVILNTEPEPHTSHIKHTSFLFGVGKTRSQDLAVSPAKRFRGIAIPGDR